jgi:DNA-binding transcriptional ArsR family regulator
MAASKPKSARAHRKGARGAKVPKPGVARLAPPKTGPLRRYDLALMARTKPPRPDFVVAQLAARGEIGLLWGKQGIGKSLLAEAACAAVGTGADVAGLECKKGKVVYADAENGEHEVHRRVRSLGLSAATTAIYDAQASVHVVEHDQFFRAVLQYEKPDLLVLDSLRRLSPGSDENDSGAMAEIVSVVKSWAQEFNLAVLLIHHARKNGDSFRGSSAITDQVSISHEMLREALPGADPHLRRLRCEKMRIDREPPDMWLSIDAKDGRLAVTASDAPTALPVSGTARVDVAAEVLDALASGPMSRPVIATALGRDKKDGTLRRALQQLDEAGSVEQLDDRKWRLVAQSPPPPLGVGTPGDGDSQTAGAKPVATGDSKVTDLATRRKRKTTSDEE